MSGECLIFLKLKRDGSMHGSLLLPFKINFNLVIHVRMRY